MVITSIFVINLNPFYSIFGFKWTLYIVLYVHCFISGSFVNGMPSLLPVSYWSYYDRDIYKTIVSYMHCTKAMKFSEFFEQD